MTSHRASPPRWAALVAGLAATASFLGHESPARAAPPAPGWSPALSAEAFADIPARANRFDRARRGSLRPPVVLLHGTWASARRLAPLVDRLSADGFRVYAFNYGRDTGSVSGSAPGVYGTAPVTRSARELASFVDLVRSRTGADRVDLVGHSQGGLVIRRYLHAVGGSAVRRVVTLGSPHHGTTLHGLSALAGAQGRFPHQTRPLRESATRLLGFAAIDQLHGSPLLADTNRHGDTVAGVGYTAIITGFDQVVFPAESGFLGGARVTNIKVQDRHPRNRVDHLTLPRDRQVQNLVIAALRPKARPDAG